MGLFGGGSKVSTKRIEPPARKLANTLLSMEAVRGLSGIEGPGDILERQRLRSQALQDVDLQNREAMRGLGERGIEGPGMYERLIGMREGALGNLIGARNAAIAAKRAGATSILQGLLSQNQPYTKTKVKESGMSKAAPFMKMGGQVLGGLAGTIVGGPAGAAVGSQLGGAVGGAAADDASKMTPAGSETAGATGSEPTAPATPYSLGEGAGAPSATLNEATGGEIGQTPESATTQLLKKPKSLTGNQTGLARLQYLFGGM